MPQTETIESQNLALDAEVSDNVPPLGLEETNTPPALGIGTGLDDVNSEAETSELTTNFVLEESQVVADDLVPDTAAQGNFSAVLNGNRLDVAGTYSELTSDLLFVGGEDNAGNPESPIHLHVGAPGEAGPILRNLEIVDDGDNSGSFSGSFDLSEEDAALVANDGVYVNLHTVDNPDGELRGQIDTPEEGDVGVVELSAVEVAANSEFLGLTDNNTLVSFNPQNPGAATSIEVTGIDGDLLGIDTRPADGQVYSVTTENNIYTIDSSSGEATFVSTLDIPFEGAEISGFDFNPVADRLRLVGGNDQDFRINVDTGEVIEDGTLAFAEGDVNSDADPNITASAYTNSVDGAESTELYNIDTDLNSLVLQDPPNDGTLSTVGDLGVDPTETAGFDIVSSSDSDNQGFAVSSNSVLYAVNLETGAVNGLGAISEPETEATEGFNFRGLTTVSNNSNVPEEAPDAPETIEMDDMEPNSIEMDDMEPSSIEMDDMEEGNLSESGLIEVTVTVENLAPENGTPLTPLWVGFHDGTFDTYDRGRPVSAGVESLAEDGDTSGISREFIQSGLGAVDGTILGEGGENPAEIDPGETTSMTFTLDPNALDSRFFNYASMILPSNDTWIANGQPDAHEIFDEDGNFLGADIVVAGGDGLDAGTEVNDETEASTAFFSQAAPNTGITESGVVQEAEGFIGGGRILSDPQFANADYIQPDYEFARISITADGLDNSSSGSIASPENVIDSLDDNALENTFNSVNNDSSSFLG